MKRSLLLFFIFTITLLINNNIKYYGLISLFLILPYFIHTINLSIRKKLAAKDSYIGREAKRQLEFFSSKVYRMLILIPTILLGIILFIMYTVVVLNNSFELHNVILLSISGILLIGFLWQFYLEIEKNYERIGIMGYLK
ncbi:hypothetical protein [uncultured Streptococcus sp.]|uniref:hypothetical protein n=1 Tax=uncultured Streptococcus sp. TaxID=83427 RepID=UPI002597DC54|nr:hypothetical protein [uncultured Streptococcus sp.]